MRAAQEDVGAWQHKWDEATRGLAKADVPPPDDALFALDGVEKILGALEKAGDYDVRIAGIDRDAKSFCADVRVLAERLGETETIEDGSEDAWIEALHKRLTAVLQEDERRREACKRLKHLRTVVAQGDKAVEDARLTLKALREEAQCGADEDLAVVERRSADVLKCQSELERIAKDLVRSGDGASIADLERAAVGADKDAIDVRLADIARELPEVEKELSEARDTRASA